MLLVSFLDRHDCGPDERIPVLAMHSILKNSSLHKGARFQILASKGVPQIAALVLQVVSPCAGGESSVGL